MVAVQYSSGKLAATDVTLMTSTKTAFFYAAINLITSTCIAPLRRAPKPKSNGHRRLPVYLTIITEYRFLVGGDSDLNVDASLHVVGGDLADNVSRRLDVDDSLVDAHLVRVPGLGTLTVGGLTGGDLQNLGGDADRALGVELVLLRTRDDVVGDCC